MRLLWSCSLAGLLAALVAVPCRGDVIYRFSTSSIVEAGIPVFEVAAGSSVDVSVFVEISEPDLTLLIGDSIESLFVSLRRDEDATANMSYVSDDLYDNILPNLAFGNFGAARYGVGGAEAAISEGDVQPDSNDQVLIATFTITAGSAFAGINPGDTVFRAFRHEIDGNTVRTLNGGALSDPDPNPEDEELAHLAARFIVRVTDGGGLPTDVPLPSAGFASILLLTLIAGGRRSRRCL